jgi:hypothetical protein
LAIAIRVCVSLDFLAHRGHVQNAFGSTKYTARIGRQSNARMGKMAADLFDEQTDWDRDDPKAVTENWNFAFWFGFP